jgi:hypothetical protein
LRIGSINKLSSFVGLVTNKLPILSLHFNFSTILKTLENLLKAKRTFNQNKVVVKINILKQNWYSPQNKNEESSIINAPSPFWAPKH